MIPIVIVKNKADSPVLDSLNGVDVFESVRVPYGAGVLQEGSDKGSVCSKFYRTGGPIKVSADNIEGFSGGINNIGNVGVPFKVRCKSKAKVF